jgi:2-keto-3-deoxy-L-rhamnonate aldolase RhmA
VPQVASVEEAARAAGAVRYTGSRGISAFSRGNRFGAAGPDFRSDGDAALACIVQIETAGALEAVEEIAALEDVDALLMGPADLSNDLGVTLDLESEPLVDAARRVGDAAAGSGKTAAIYVGLPDQAAPFRQLGFTMFACTFESAVLAAGSAAVAAGLKAG